MIRDAYEGEEVPRSMSHVMACSCSRLAWIAEAGRIVLSNWIAVGYGFAMTGVVRGAHILTRQLGDHLRRGVQSGRCSSPVCSRRRLLCVRSVDGPPPESLAIHGPAGDAVHRPRPDDPEPELDRHGADGAWPARRCPARLVHPAGVRRDDPLDRRWVSAAVGSRPWRWCPGPSAGGYGSPERRPTQRSVRRGTV